MLQEQAQGDRPVTVLECSFHLDAVKQKIEGVRFWLKLLYTVRALVYRSVVPRLLVFAISRRRVWTETEA